jgi:hypothetical protein
VRILWRLHPLVRAAVPNPFAAANRRLPKLLRAAAVQRNAIKIRKSMRHRWVTRWPVVVAKENVVAATEALRAQFAFFHGK